MDGLEWFPDTVDDDKEVPYTAGHSFLVGLDSKGRLVACDPFGKRLLNGYIMHGNGRTIYDLNPAFGIILDDIEQLRAFKRENTKKKRESGANKPTNGGPCPSGLRCPDTIGLWEDGR